MAQFTKYDEVLTSILANEKSIIGFLSAIFNFLSRRTDFYYIPKEANENMGFPPGVAEEIVLKVLRKCDPKYRKTVNDTINVSEINDEIMCSTVAQEVEIVSEEDNHCEESESGDESNVNHKTNTHASNDTKFDFPKDYDHPIIPTQQSSESYNGALYENYSWSQTIMDLEVTVKLPPDINSSKHLKVAINHSDISVTKCDGAIILKDTLPHKIKPIDCFWSITDNKLLLHLEKVQERWWKKFLDSEKELDLSKIDCSRPLNELPEDHIAKVHELQWNQEQKFKGLPTSDEIKNINILKKAWNSPGSPFRGKEFDPNILYKET